MLDAARRRPIQHLMINTNGVRIAHDEAFAARLAEYMPDFEVYLQFDSFERDALMALRGADLRQVRERAIERLNRYAISTTLVVTLKKGLNTHEIGRIIDYALAQPCVRGVTFQPIQAAGRLDGFDPATDRLTLTEVRRRILEQSAVFRPEDVIPVPCHPDSLAMAYALKIDDRVVPLTGLIDPTILIEGGRNTIQYEQDEAVRAGLFKAFCHQPLAAVRRGQPSRSPVLPAPRRGASEPRLSESVPRHHHAVHRRVLVRRSLDQEDVRPHRPSRWTADSVRHLQSVLSRRSGTDAAGGAARRDRPADGQAGKRRLKPPRTRS